MAAIESAGLSLPVYLNIMSPAVGWLVGMVGRGASKETFVEVFQENLGLKDEIGRLLEEV